MSSLSFRTNDGSAVSLSNRTPASRDERSKGQKKDMRHHRSALVASMLLLCCVGGPAGAQDIADAANVPSDIKAILDKPLYKGAIWGLRVVAINQAVTHMLADMRGRPAFPQYFASLPIMGVDGRSHS
jgi:hypothetical protein